MTDSTAPFSVPCTNCVQGVAGSATSYGDQYATPPASIAISSTLAKAVRPGSAVTASVTAQDGFGQPILQMNNAIASVTYASAVTAPTLTYPVNLHGALRVLYANGSATLAPLLFGEPGGVYVLNFSISDPPFNAIRSVTVSVLACSTLEAFDAAVTGLCNCVPGSARSGAATDSPCACIKGYAQSGEGQSAACSAVGIVASASKAMALPKWIAAPIVVGSVLILASLAFAFLWHLKRSVTLAMDSHLNKLVISATELRLPAVSRNREDSTADEAMKAQESPSSTFGKELEMLRSPYVMFRNGRATLLQLSRSDSIARSSAEEGTSETSDNGVGSMRRVGSMGSQISGANYGRQPSLVDSFPSLKARKASDVILETSTSFVEDVSVDIEQDAGLSPEMSELSGSKSPTKQSSAKIRGRNQTVRRSGANQSQEPGSDEPASPQSSENGRFGRNVLTSSMYNRQPAGHRGSVVTADPTVKLGAKELAMWAEEAIRHLVRGRPVAGLAPAAGQRAPCSSRGRTFSLRRLSCGTRQSSLCLAASRLEARSPWFWTTRRAAP